MATEQQTMVWRHWRTNGKIASSDVKVFVREEWWRIIAFTILAAALGGALSFLQPRAWEAKSVLQIGQTDEGQPALIEAPEQVVARFESDSFIDGVFARAPLTSGDGGAQESELVRRTVRAKAFPGTHFIEISVRAFSPHDAAAFLQEAENQIVAIHAQREASAQARLRARLAEIDHEIDAANARRTQFDARLPAKGDKNAQKAVDTLLSDVAIASTRDLLFKLQTERSAVAMQSSEDHTYNTKPVGAIDVSRHPVAPRRSRYIALGALAGLLVGLLFCADRKIGWSRRVRAGARAR